MNEINITKSSALIDSTTLRKCDYKCSYSFRYPDTNVTAINNSTQLTLKCDNYSNGPAKFNGKSYNVNAIYLFAPSVHLFKGSKVAAEMIIEHAPTNGGTYFYVCIPIINGYNSNAALSDIIKQVSVQASENGESINFNKTDFTLQDIVPMKPYFFYEGVWGASSANFIVFDMSSAIGLDNETMSNLTKTISASSLKMMGGNLSFNANGPDNKIKGDLYISCRPTNVSKDTVKVTNQKTGSTASAGLDSKTKQMIVQSLIILAMIVLVIGVMYGASYLFSGEPIKFTNPFSKPAT